MFVSVNRRLLLFFLSIFFFSLALPLFLGIVKPNHVYGFRMQLTLNNESAWYAVNRVSGLAIMLASALLMAISFLSKSLNSILAHLDYYLALFFLVCAIAAPYIYASRIGS